MLQRFLQFFFCTQDTHSCHVQINMASMLVQGNLILADSNYEVLTLLRSHRDDAKGFAIMARHPYPIHTIRLRQALSQEQLSAALDSADEKQTLRGTALPHPSLCLLFLVPTVLLGWSGIPHGHVLINWLTPHKVSFVSCCF